MSITSSLKLAALAAGFALTGAACGSGGGSGAGVASLSAGESAAGAKTATQKAGQKAASNDPEQAMLDFARCMREHGVDMPDPQVDTSPGGGGAPAIALRISGDFSPEKMEKADKACRPLMGEAGPLGNVTPQQRQEMQDQMVKFSRCMREHGVDMPDPQFDTGTGGRMVKIGGTGGIDPSSKEFQRAQEDCGEIFGAGGKTGGVGTVVSGAGKAAGGFSFSAPASGASK